MARNVFAFSKARSRVNEMRILLVGDVMLGRGVNEVLRYATPEYPWGDTLPRFDEADFRICNLECAISGRGEPWPDKAFHFRTDTKNTAVLGAAHIDAVSLANNHALDFGYEALADTEMILDTARIAHAGTGRNIAAALKPAIARANGRSIGLVAFTDNEPEWEAGEARAGIAYVPVDFEEERARLLFEAIRKARARCDILVVAAHWGPNWGYEPPPRQIPFARRLVDLGADIVFGHSGHVFRAVEIYRGRPILYCAGNFVDDYAVDPDERNDESFMFFVDIDADGPVRLRLYPTIIAECQARIAPPDQAGKIAYKMTRVCEKIGTQTLWHEHECCLEIPIGRAGR